MKQKSFLGILCLAAGIVLLLACLPGMLLSRVENNHAPLFLQSLQEESLLFALLLSHVAETAGMGVVMVLIGLLCIVELPGEEENRKANDETEVQNRYQPIPPEISFHPEPPPEYRIVFSEAAPIQGKNDSISEEKKLFP